MTDGSTGVPAGNEPASLQRRLEARGGGDGPEPVVGDAGPTITDPVGVFRALEASGRFHRDNGLGRSFHPGSVSFRENLATDSLHILIHHNRIAAHVDRVSPLGLRGERPPRYSLRRTAAHNVATMAQDLVRLLHGRQGDHRSELDCEWIWPPAQSTVRTADLLDPRTTAWSVHLEARVGGALDESRLRRALAVVLRRRPADHDPLDVVDCPDDTSLDSARAELHRLPVEVTAWPPLRVRLARHPGGDVLMLTLNHAASDGVGALVVLRSIARAYAGDADGGPPLDFPAVRDLPVHPASARVSSTRRAYRSVEERLRDLLARPALLAPDQGDDDPGYGFHLVRLSADDTQRVVDVDRPGTSRNVLAAALHLAIGEWNLRHGTPGRWIGVLVPVNLRPPGWPDEIVGNFSVTARVSTSRRHRAGPTSALEAVTAQTTRNKRTRTGVALIAALQRSGLLPLWVKQSLVVLQPLTRNQQVDTAMLANLGWLDEPPSFGASAGETVEVWFSTPARAPLGLCLGAVTISGQLHLVVRYPRRLFSADAARRFAECFLSQIFLVAENRAVRRLGTRKGALRALARHALSPASRTVRAVRREGHGRGREAS